MDGGEDWGKQEKGAQEIEIEMEMKLDLSLTLIAVHHRAALASKSCLFVYFGSGLGLFGCW